MLQPKRTKFRKAHKGRIRGKATSGQNLDYGAFGLKAQEPERLTARQALSEETHRPASIAPPFPCVQRAA